MNIYRNNMILYYDFRMRENKYPNKLSLKFLILAVVRIFIYFDLYTESIAHKAT